MATLELTSENFNETIENNDIVIVDFWAPWCGPCKSFAPTFEAASESHPDVVFAKVNTEDETELAQGCGIRSIPTLMLFRQKILLFNEAGALPPAQLEDMVAKVKELDMDQVRASMAEAEAEQAQGE
ncbi:MAG: thioredoxin [Methylophilaceae bacterium]|jgi:thioredoxin 1|nr:thioredoxin [Gammaproteobacteria bacterium]MDG1820879.1 thioredoxin [Methylophilaceae bacterium]